MEIAERASFKNWWTTDHAPIPTEVVGEEFDAWGAETGRFYSHASWKAVDWCVDAKERGYEYEDMARIMGRPTGSIRNLMKIGRAFPPVTRRYKLGPTFYDAAKALPSEDDRETVLAQAVEQSYTRDEFRAFVAEYRTLKAIPDDPKPPQPAWNNGTGGKFGDQAQRAESTEPSPFEGQPESELSGNTGKLPCGRCGKVYTPDHDCRPMSESGMANYAGTIAAVAGIEPVKEGAGGGQRPMQDWLGNDVGTAPYWENQSKEWHKRAIAAEDANYSLRAEIGTLKAKLAGIWESAVELDEDDMKGLDAIVKYRKSKFEKDEITRQTEAQAAIRRRYQEITRAR